MALGWLVLGLGLVWATKDTWAVGMIVGSSSPEYAPIEPPSDVGAVIEVEGDGARIRAWVLEPEAAPRGTLLLLHGIHDSKTSHLSSARRHAAHGFRVVLVDSRGHGESSGRWLSYGVHESHDLMLMTDAIEAHGLLAPPLAVVGTSYGAATAIQYAALDDRVRTTVALAPFSSLREVVPAYVEWMVGPASSLISSSWESSVVDAAGRRAGFDPDRACPRCVAPEITGSLLLIHGRDDERIPWRQSARIRDAVSSEVRLMIVDGAGHLDVGSAPGVPDAIEAWLEIHAADAGRSSGRDRNG